MQIKTLQYYKSLLDPHDQKIYDTLFHHWMHFDRQFLIRPPHRPLADLINAVHMDNPILFYINFHEVVYSTSILGITVHGGYLYTKAEAVMLLENCRNWGEKIMGKLPRIGVVEQALWLHDLLIDNVHYGDNNKINAHNLIGVVKDSVAVCEGIAMAYKYLCDLADIPCIVVSGTLDQIPHAWNMLWICNGSSFVDVTNDMQNGSDYRRTHFLRRSSEMVGYTWNQKQIPHCNVYNADHPHVRVSTREDFFRAVSSHISCESFAVHLNLQHPLTENQLQDLISECTLRSPKLALRNVTFSLSTQTVYIQKHRGDIR